MPFDKKREYVIKNLQLENLLEQSTLNLSQIKSLQKELNQF